MLELGLLIHWSDNQNWVCERFQKILLNLLLAIISKSEHKKLSIRIYKFLENIIIIKDQQPKKFQSADLISFDFELYKQAIQSEYLSCPKQNCGSKNISRIFGLSSTYLCNECLDLFDT